MIITLKTSISNISLQVGDVAYYALANAEPSDPPNQIGEITGIIGNSMIQIDSYENTPPADAFLMFSKNKAINTTSLKGYYASVTLTHNNLAGDDPMEAAELFAVSSEVTESSK
tara:strand:- start:211 stop:552 length:342 start_codon:yes stop_codon:yes gene_type:complete